MIYTCGWLLNVFSFEFLRSPIPQFLFQRTVVPDRNPSVGRFTVSMCLSLWGLSLWFPLANPQTRVDIIHRRAQSDKALSSQTKKIYNSAWQITWRWVFCQGTFSGTTKGWPWGATATLIQAPGNPPIGILCLVCIICYKTVTVH